MLRVGVDVGGTFTDLLKFFLSPEAPPNAGLYRQIDLNIPEGTWLNPMPSRTTSAP